MRFAVEFFLSYESLKSRKRRIFFPTSYIQGHVRGSRWVGQGWSVAKKKGDVRKKKRSRPRKVVSCHKKGTWEWRKEKDQGRQEGDSAKARFRVSSTKNFFFWFTSIWVWKQLVLFEVSAPTRLSLQGSHVRRKFRKRTTLRSKSSTLKELLYAGWRSRCEAFVAMKSRTIALEQSVSKKAVIWQATINWETVVFCSRNMGAHVRCTYAKKLVSSNLAKILEVATKIRETCEKTLFTPSSPVKATKLYRVAKSPINIKR
jgi:hypothetical protein